MATLDSNAKQLIRLVIADVDGTLVTKDKVLTARAIAAVDQLGQAGIAFTITSGRPPLGMIPLIHTLRISEPIAAFNGGVFFRPDLSVLRLSLLPREISEGVIGTISSHGLDVWLYTDTDWLVRDARAPHVAREEWTVKFPPKVIGDFGLYLGRAVKIVGVSDDYDAVAQCEADLQRACGKTASAARSQPYYLDVTHADATKGYVVTTLSDMLRIPAEQIATIGDMPNDVLMFEKSGMSIAMGHASPEVQRSARFITDSSEEEGFAKAMEQFVLQQRPATSPQGV